MKKPWILIAFFTALSCLAQSDLDEGIRLLDDRKIDDAVTFFESYTSVHAEDSRAHFYLGKSYFMKEEYDKAMESLEQCLKIDGNFIECYLWLGDCYGIKAQTASVFKKMGFAKKCRESYLRAVEIDPSYIPARHYLINYYLSAPAIAGGGTDKALEQANAILALDPKQGNLELARIYSSEKEYDKEEKALLEAIALDPEHRDVRYRLGYVYQNTQQYDKAFELFEEMIQTSPEDVNALYQIGRTSALSGQNLERGIACLTQFLDTEWINDGRPTLSGAHFRLGNIYEHMKEKDKAIAEYRTSLNLEPGNKAAKEALDKIVK